MQLASSSTAPHVLIVDDDEDSLIIYERFLEVAGFSTSRARTAMEAFMSARTAPPSAVLLDLILPDMHGCDLLELFRTTPALERVPIIAITARVTPEIVESPETIPVPRLLLKPTTSDELVGAIRESLARVA